MEDGGCFLLLFSLLLHYFHSFQYHEQTTIKTQNTRKNSVGSNWGELLLVLSSWKCWKFVDNPIPEGRSLPAPRVLCKLSLLALRASEAKKPLFTQPTGSLEALLAISVISRASTLEITSDLFPGESTLTPRKRAVLEKEESAMVRMSNSRRAFCEVGAEGLPDSKPFDCLCGFTRELCSDPGAAQRSGDRSLFL